MVFIMLCIAFVCIYYYCFVEGLGVGLKFSFAYFLKLFFRVSDGVVSAGCFVGRVGVNINIFFYIDWTDVAM